MPSPSANATPAVYLILPDRHERARLGTLIARHGFTVREFPSIAEFHGAVVPAPGCVVVELDGPEAYELLERLQARTSPIPAIAIADAGDVSGAVRAIHAGASALIESPCAGGMLMRELRRLVS